MYRLLLITVVTAVLVAGCCDPRATITVTPNWICGPGEVQVCWSGGSHCANAIGASPPVSWLPGSPIPPDEDEYVPPAGAPSLLHRVSAEGCESGLVEETTAFTFISAKNVWDFATAVDTVEVHRGCDVRVLIFDAYCADGSVRWHSAELAASEFAEQVKVCAIRNRSELPITLTKGGSKYQLAADGPGKCAEFSEGIEGTGRWSAEVDYDVWDAPWEAWAAYCDLLREPRPHEVMGSLPDELLESVGALRIPDLGVAVYFACDCQECDGFHCED